MELPGENQRWSQKSNYEGGVHPKLQGLQSLIMPNYLRWLYIYKKLLYLLSLWKVLETELSATQQKDHFMIYVSLES